MAYEYVQQNLCAITERIRAAEAAAGREAGSVTMIAAVKYAEDGELRALYELGVHEFGENRVQQLLAHYEALGEARESVRFHFIGSLQTNKVKYIIDKVTMIHSLDSERLAAEIDRQAAKRGLTMDVLVEINSGREESKGGLAPDEVEDFCQKLAAFPHLRLRGFMTMAPKCEKIEEYRKYFRETSQQCLDIWQKKLDNIGGTPILSMGMSASFEAAIMEGATMVRVGGALFRA